MLTLGELIMAAIPPLSGNNCRGVYENGLPNIKVKCVKNLDDEGAKVFSCVTWRYFRVSCPKLNQQCSSLSGAFLPAITVCTQKLF